MSDKDINFNDAANAGAAEDIKPETPPVEVEKTPEEKLAEANDKYLRLYADFENFRKRVSKEKMDQLKYAGEEVFKQLIPVMDDFERAMKSSEKNTDIKGIREGVQLIYNKFKNMLIQGGVAEMKAAGKDFDPEIHDAVTNIPAPKPDLKGKVVEEVEKGYWLNGKILRHAKVVVGQ
jgi:molecular chaperone GrpE